MEKAQFFRYRTGKTILHKLPPALKILLLLTLAISSFYLPTGTAFCAWLFVLLLELLFRFPFRGIIADLQPAFFYMAMLYLASVIQHILQGTGPDSVQLTTVQILTPDSEKLSLAMHLTLSLSVSSIFYRTTSNVQFHEGFSVIERTLTRQKKARYADQLSLTMTFIPRIVKNWQQIDTAWKARGGKNGIRKILTLIPRLFAVSMDDAYQTALAVMNRNQK
ncbi:MAG: hypothetical protein K6G80_06410 [Treponema sp.]|nr:hypothetical protein [Treponema sp.]